MPPIVDLRTAVDSRDLVHQAVQALVEGKLVGLPTETGYVAAALPLNSAAVKRLAALGEHLHRPRLLLALKNPLESLDYLPRMGELGRKLIRRFWPGPVTLLFGESAEAGLLGAFPEDVGPVLHSPGRLAARVPSQEFIGHVMRLLTAPLVVIEEASTDGTIFTSAADLAAATGDELALVFDAGPPRHEQPTSLVEVQPQVWEVVREGVVARRMLKRLAGTMILFVCTGNTCRSPMAEGLFRRILADQLQCSEDDLVDRGYIVASAGVAAGPGSPASPEGVTILAERGADISGHASQSVTPQLLSQADQVFTMTRGHRELLVREFPEMAPRVRLISRNGIDVIDPIGAGMKEYRRCADQIEKYVREIVAELDVEAAKKSNPGDL